MTDQKAAEGPQEGSGGGSAGLGPSEALTGAQAGADGLGLREVIAGAISDVNSIHPGTIADAVYTRLKPHLAPHYQRAVDAATAAEQRAQQAEADRKTLGQAALDYQQRAWDAEATIRRVRALADRLDEFAENALKTSDRHLYATLARDIRQRIDAPPAHNAGPTVAECAAQDRAYWTDKHAGEQP